MIKISTKKGWLFLGMVCLWLLFYAWNAAGVELWQPQYMADLLKEGLAKNLEIKSQEQIVASAKAQAMAAGALDDPMIGFGVANLPTDTFSFDQEPMTQKQISVSQKVPWPGKRDLASRLMILNALKEEFMLTKKKLALSKMIARSYFDLGFTDQRLILNAELKNLINQILDISETRYTVGKGLQMDVLQGQLELSRLADEETTLSKQRRSIEDNINRLLSRKEFQPLPIAPKPKVLDILFNTKRLTDQALQNNPQLNVLKIEIQSTEIEVMLAEKKYYPDFDFKLSYGQRDEDRTGRDLADFVSATVGLNLPLWKHKKQDNWLAASQNRANAAKLSAESLSAALPFQIDDLVNEIESAKKNYRIYEDDILPQAEQWVASAVSAYEVDKLEFDTMVTAHMRLLQLRLKQQEYLFTIFKKYAELEDITGTALFAL